MGSASILVGEPWVFTTLVTILGLLVGSFGMRETMDRGTRVAVNSFWSLVDDVLNAILFVLIGMLCAIGMY